MNKKKSLRVLVIALAVVMVFGVCSTAFAVGERISHSGWSMLTYCSTQTIQQKNDTKLYCESASKTAGSDMLAAVWANRYRDSAILGKISEYQQLDSGITLNMPKNPTVRVICVRIANDGESINKSIYTSGNWVMRA